ncbi:MAG: hypothetical protein AB7P20_00385 [Rhizobiaceae bacterium]
MVFIAPALFFAFIQAAVAASTCDAVADSSSFRLLTVHETALEEESATREEMDRIASAVGAPAEVREAHPLMLILARAGADVELEHRPINARDTGENTSFCDVPASIVVRLGVLKRRVILHRSAARDTCVRMVLLDHFRQHSWVLDETIDRFIAEHRAGIARALRDLTQKTAPDPVSASENLEVGMASLIGALYREFGLKLEKSRLIPDTPAALGELRKACDGKLHRLEQELGAPGDQHAARRTLRPVSLQ